MTYKIPEVFRQGNLLSTGSTVLQSHRLHPVSRERMVYFEVNVGNGFVVPKPLPYGIFAEVVNRGSGKESVLQVWVADGYYINSPQFAQNKRRVFNFDRFIKEAEIQTQIVLKDSPLITDADTWESSVENIDETHSVSEKVQVIELNPITVGEWDDRFNTSVTVTTELVKASVAEAASDFPSSLTAGAPNTWVKYEEVRCGWYVKTTESFTFNNRAVGTTRNFFWPAVLQSIDLGVLEGQLENGEEYLASVLIDARYKESYNGPSRAVVTYSWTANVPVSVAPLNMMYPDAFQYKGIFFSFTSPEALHPVVTFNENVGSNHPTLKANQFRNKTYPGTNKTDWPASVTFTEEPVPYRGGWIQETVEIFSPV